MNEFGKFTEGFARFSQLDLLPWNLDCHNSPPLTLDFYYLIINMDPVVRIGGATYERETVTEIVVPEGVTRIDDSTFYNCFNLVSISLPNSLTRIGIGAFGRCRSLTTITIPPSVTYIDEVAFAGCSSLSTVNVHPSTQIHYRAFGKFSPCTTLNTLARARNLSVIAYIRLQYSSRINLRVAVFMCTSSQVRYDLKIPQTQDNLPTVANGELDGVLALRKLHDDVWREIIEFL